VEIPIRELYQSTEKWYRLFQGGDALGFQGGSALAAICVRLTVQGPDSSPCPACGVFIGIFVSRFYGFFLLSFRRDFCGVFVLDFVSVVF
jgi:hypothetical protein